MNSYRVTIAGAYLLFLSLFAGHAYFYSLYDIDMMGYIGNALAISSASIQQIHDDAYRALAAETPREVQDHLLGRDMAPPISQWKSRQDRATNAYHFAEYLPCFAIRPIFNELVYLLHFKLGVGLVRATIVIPVVSYWCIGVLVFWWLSSYIGYPRAALFSLLLMLSPPILDLARFNTPDALACLLVLAALYLVFERNYLFSGLTLLLVSVYVRTDNVVMAVGVLGYCAFITHQLDRAKAAVLASVAIASVFLINHFAGDYGIRLLYYRSFIEIPLAPGELVAHFGPADYLQAFRKAISLTMNSYFPLFALMGVAGYLGRKTRVSQAIAAVTTFYVAAHFLLFPSGQERFWGPFREIPFNRTQVPPSASSLRKARNIRFHSMRDNECEPEEKRKDEATLRSSSIISRHVRHTFDPGPTISIPMEQPVCDSCGGLAALLSCF